MHSQTQTSNIWTSWTNTLQKISSSKLLIFLLLSSGCGQIEHKRQNNIDPEFSRLVDLFEQEQSEVVDIDITFKDIDYPTVGLCWSQTYSNGEKQGIEIEIDPDFWFASSEMKKEELLFHELGHCILNRDHEDEMLYQRIPKSVMYPYVFEWAYERYRSYYVDELKNTNVLLTDYLN